MTDRTAPSPRRAALALAAGLGLAALIAQPAGAQPRTASLQLAPSGHVVTDVSIEGEGPWRFAVDTGASHTAIAMPLAEHYGFISTRIELGPVQALTGRFEAERFALRDIAFPPGVRVDQVEAVVVPVEPDETLYVDGLLGADVFGEARLALDLDALTMTLDAAPPDYADGVLDPQSNLLWGEARSRSVTGPINVLIDTGATRTIVNSALSAKRRGGVRFNLVIGGVDGRTREESQAVTLEGLRVGGLCVAAMPALEADLDVFRAMGWANEPAMVLGLDLLRHARIVIDRSAGVFELSPASDVAACPRRRNERVQRES